MHYLAGKYSTLKVINVSHCSQDRKQRWQCGVKRTAAAIEVSRIRWSEQQTPQEKSVPRDIHQSQESWGSYEGLLGGSMRWEATALTKTLTGWAGIDKCIMRDAGWRQEAVRYCANELRGICGRGRKVRYWAHGAYIGGTPEHNGGKAWVSLCMTEKREMGRGGGSRDLKIWGS